VFEASIGYVMSPVSKKKKPTKTKNTPNPSYSRGRDEEDHG
jgi:hypothetical protein